MRTSRVSLSCIAPSSGNPEVGHQIRILQFGETGQLGRALTRLMRRDARFDLHVVPRAGADFRYPDQVATAVRNSGAVDLVVNATSYTAVDKAETEREVAQLVNVDSIEALGAACCDKGVPLIHVSTDYVFDGKKKGPYVETDQTEPLNWYGQTKRGGELALARSGAEHVVLRTTWLYGASGTNFLRTMLRLGREREELRVVNDQRGAPTSATDLAAAILAIAEQLKSAVNHAPGGIYHCTNIGETTWYGFAAAIFEAERAKGRKVPRLIPITTADYPTPARRPANSVLDCSKVITEFGIRLRPWRVALRECLAEVDQIATGEQ